MMKVDIALNSKVVSQKVNTQVMGSFKKVNLNSKESLLKAIDMAKEHNMIEDRRYMKGIIRKIGSMGQARSIDKVTNQNMKDILEKERNMDMGRHSIAEERQWNKDGFRTMYIEDIRE